MARRGLCFASPWGLLSKLGTGGFVSLNSQSRRSRARAPAPLRAAHLHRTCGAPHTCPGGRCQGVQVSRGDQGGEAETHRDSRKAISAGGYLAMPSYRELVSAFRDLGLGPHSRLLVHASLPPFAPDVGGPQALLGALTATCEIIVVPSFTSGTLVTPPFGPPYNGLRYGDDSANSEAEFFHADLATDPLLADLAEAMLQHPQSERSSHPALSFCGIRAGQALAAQSL